MSNATAYFAIAAMSALRASNQALPKSRREFLQLIQERYNRDVDDAALDKAIQQLQVWGRISVTQDKYAGETLSLYNAKTPEAFDLVSEIGHKDVVEKATAGGVDWFKKVFGNQIFWDDLYNDSPPESEAVDQLDQEAEDIPASDRIVSRSDNRIEIEVVEADIRSIVEEIETSNEASVELGEDKEIISGELRAAEVLISQSTFRLSKLSGLVLPALRFLAEKFASGAIGELAKRLIIAILGLG